MSTAYSPDAQIAPNPQQTHASRSFTLAWWTPVPRNQFFAALYILGLANGLFGRVLLATRAGQDWTGILGVDISVVVLFACYAGLSTLLSGPREDLRPLDLLAGLLFVLCTLLPIFALSWVAITALSFYIFLFANHDSGRVRGAWILLALTVPMLWGRLLFQLFTSPILAIDASLVAFFLGTERTGNLVGFRDGSGYMALIPACSSFTNMSLAVLCWVTVTQWAGHRWRPMDILWCLLAVGSMLVVNVTRIVLTGWSHSSYEIIHSEMGGTIFGVITLVVIIGVSVIGARRAVFSSV